MPLLILLLVLGVAELSVLILVGQAIGVLSTIALLLGGSLLGGWLLRREGRRTLRELNEAARMRRPPDRELSDGVLIAVGGVLIFLPGFISDIAGLLCLLPPVRAVLRRRLERSAQRRSEKMREQVFTVYGPTLYGQQAGQAGGPAGDFTRGRRRDEASDDVVEGEVVSVEEDEENSAPGPELPPRAQQHSEDDRR